MSLVSGFRNMQKQSDQRQETRDSDYIRNVILRDDGDMVVMRMVTDSDPEYAEQSGVPHVFVQGEYHRVPSTSRRGNEFFKDVLCHRVYDHEQEEWVGQCPMCVAQINSRTQFMAWVWVYAFYYRSQDSRYQPGDPTTEKFKREMVRRGDKQEVLYKESVNQYCLWQDGWYMLEKLRQRTAQFGTLCDRDYSVQRNGVRKSQQTERILSAATNPSVFDATLLTAAFDLPKLEDVAAGKVRTYGGKPESAPGEVDMNEVPIDDGLMGMEVPIEGFGPDQSVQDLDELSTSLGAPSALTEEMYIGDIQTPDLEDPFGDLERMAAPIFEEEDLPENADKTDEAND